MKFKILAVIIFPPMLYMHTHTTPIVAHVQICCLSLPLSFFLFSPRHVGITRRLETTKREKKKKRVEILCVIKTISLLVANVEIVS